MSLITRATPKNPHHARVTAAKTRSAAKANKRASFGCWTAHCDGGRSSTIVSGKCQTFLCRRRHQQRRPPLAKIRPGRPAPAMGPGTAAEVPKYLFIRSGRRNVKFEHAIRLFYWCIGSRGWKWECKTVSDVGHSTKAVQRVEDQLGSAGCRCWHPRSGSARFGGQVGGYHENRLNVSRLQKNRFKPSPDQAGVQPLRQRICFEPDPRNREAKSFKELDTVSLRW